MDRALFDKYAELVVKVGVNIQKDQTLVITSPLETADFARKMAELAYREGARDVIIQWDDQLFKRIRYENASKEVLGDFPDWKRDFYLTTVREGAAYISISATDPELMKGVDSEKIAISNKAMKSSVKEYIERRMSNKNVWNVVSVPTKPWAKKVFPDLSEDEAVEKLWETIFKIVRVDRDDPVAAWKEHKGELQKSLDYLNAKQFKYLYLRNSLGTDLKVELPENHIWIGGSDLTPEGLEFIANIPTEEVFTAPKKTGVNGTVVSSKPLNYNGNLVDKFSITFKEGKIVDFSAEVGEDVLKKIIDTDEGSHYLGEIALVPYDSPISNSNILFYNTLFDENASCHLAIGKAYPVCVKDGENMTNEELDKIGVNDSMVHEDFMLGTSDLEIIGVTGDGKEVEVFKNGNFAF